MTEPDFAAQAASIAPCSCGGDSADSTAWNRHLDGCLSNLCPEIESVIRAAFAAGRESGLEEAALQLEDACDDESESALGAAAQDAYNYPELRSAYEKLKAWSAVVVSAIRALKSKELSHE